MIILVRIEHEGETYEGVIDGNEFFVQDLMKAITANEDPVQVLAELANVGSKVGFSLHSPQVSQPI